MNANLEFKDELLQRQLISQEFIIDDKHRFIFIPKTGSTSILELIAKNINRDYYEYIQKRLNVGQSHAIMRYHSRLNKIDIREQKAIDRSLVRYMSIREPIERFKSACDQIGFSPKQAIQHIKDFILKDHKVDKDFSPVKESILNVHLYPQYSFLVPYNTLNVPLTLLRFPESLSIIKKEVNLQGEIPHINRSKKDRDEYNLNSEELEFVRRLYKKDFDLFNSI